MALPLAIPVAWSWVLSIGGRLLGKVALPLFAGLTIWALENSVGLISWGILAILDGLLTLLLTAMGEVDLPDAPSWDSILPAAALDLLHLAGIFQGLGTFISALIIRLLVFLVTLGRF